MLLKEKKKTGKINILKEQKMHLVFQGWRKGSEDRYSCRGWQFKLIQFNSHDCFSECRR